MTATTRREDIGARPSSTSRRLDLRHVEDRECGRLGMGVMDVTTAY